MGKIVCQEPLCSHKNADFFIFKGEIRISRIATYTVALLPGAYLSGLEITPAYFFGGLTNAPGPRHARTVPKKSRGEAHCAADQVPTKGESGPSHEARSRVLTPN